MQKSPLPWNEELRLLNLQSYQILDTTDEEEFNDLVLLASEICNCPISLISFVDKDRQWFKAKVGLDVEETTRDVSFCAHAITEKDVFIVENALNDERFRANPHVTEGLKIRFYAGAQLTTAAGFNLGTICVIDDKPHSFSSKAKEHLRRLARQVVKLLELRATNKILEKHAILERNQRLALEDVQEALHLKTKEAEAAAEAKSVFLSSMSHEIRTPMNAIIGFTQLLLQNPREDQLEYIKSLKFSADHLLLLINDVLDFSKIEAGKIKFEEIPFSPIELIQNIQRCFFNQSVEKKLSFNLRVDKNIPTQLLGDPTRLTQILNNLLSNAFKFTEKGSVDLSVQVKEVEPDAAVLHFEVRDTGIGIAENQVSRIFESFSQAGIDINRKYGGTGLGLAIIKKLLELQGSTIEIKSQPGKGSSFYFSIRFRKSNKTIQSRNESSDEAEQSIRGIRLLLVEDNKINVLLAKQFLNQWEVQYSVACNGVEAVEMVRKEKFDIILMDLQMPQMDGYDATRKIRSLPGNYFKEIPIIALTASALNEEKEQSIKAGMNDYVLKPFNANELKNKISRHLKTSPKYRQVELV
jgi:signal transduction histidine kinase/ActR/RegA family two-component response regulator